MVAKRFFYVCAGICLLALTYHFGSRNATAQAGSSPEVAVLTGEVADQGTIPLPHYQDGSEALESECRWIVSPKVMWWENGPFETGTPLMEYARCSTIGRVVRVYMCQGGCGPGGDCDPPSPGCDGPFHGVANYFIIAIRNTSPTPAMQPSWGGVKARYRLEGSAKARDK